MFSSKIWCQQYLWQGLSFRVSPHFCCPNGEEPFSPAPNAQWKAWGGECESFAVPLRWHQQCGQAKAQCSLHVLCSVLKTVKVLKCLKSHRQLWWLSGIKLSFFASLLLDTICIIPKHKAPDSSHTLFGCLWIWNNLRIRMLKLLSVRGASIFFIIIIKIHIFRRLASVLQIFIWKLNLRSVKRSVPWLDKIAFSIDATKIISSFVSFHLFKAQPHFTELFFCLALLPLQENKAYYLLSWNTFNNETFSFTHGKTQSCSLTIRHTLCPTMSANSWSFPNNHYLPSIHTHQLKQKTQPLCRQFTNWVDSVEILHYRDTLLSYLILLTANNGQQ